MISTRDLFPQYFFLFGVKVLTNKRMTNSFYNHNKRLAQTRIDKDNTVQIIGDELMIPSIELSKDTIIGRFKEIRNGGSKHGTHNRKNR